MAFEQTNPCTNLDRKISNHGAKQSVSVTIRLLAVFIVSAGLVISASPVSAGMIRAPLAPEIHNAVRPDAVLIARKSKAEARRLLARVKKHTKKLRKLTRKLKSATAKLKRETKG